MDALRIQHAAGLEADAWQAVFAAPPFDLEPLSAAELDALFHREPEAELCERLLASAARARGAVDVELAEGLDALTGRIVSPSAE